MTDIDPVIAALVETAYLELTPELIEILSRSAAASYAAGAVDSYRTIDLDGELDFRMVSEDASRYAKEYRELLDKEGATMISGEAKPWLKDLTAEERSKIGEIIDRGIKEGRPTGVKELKKGGYPKGSIAGDLEDYFQARKSHASMVARTEVARIQNHASLDSFDRHGVDRVTVHDGHAHGSCTACNEIDGEIWTTPYARAHDDHPNGTRYYDAYYGDQPAVRG